MWFLCIIIPVRLSRIQLCTFLAWHLLMILQRHGDPHVLLILEWAASGHLKLRSSRKLKGSCPFVLVKYIFYRSGRNRPVSSLYVTLFVSGCGYFRMLTTLGVRSSKTGLYLHKDTADCVIHKLFDMGHSISNSILGFK